MDCRSARGRRDVHRDAEALAAVGAGRAGSHVADRRGIDREIGAGVGYRVVVAGRQRPLPDRIGADRLAGVADKGSCHLVAPDEARHGVGQRRVGRAVGLRLRGGCDRQRLLADRQVRPRVADRVVAPRRQRPLPDRVGADRLARVADKGSCHLVAPDEARHGVGQRRVGRAVGLRLRGGCDRQRLLADRQVRPRVADRVVVARRQRPLLDRVGADVLARVADERARHLVGPDETLRRVGQRGVGRAVGLRLRGGCDRQRLLRDGNRCGVRLRDVARGGHLAPDLLGTDIDARGRRRRIGTVLRGGVAQRRVLDGARDRHADAMRRAVIGGGVVGDGHIACGERLVQPAHHESRRLHLPGDTVGIGGVRERIGAVPRNAPGALSLPTQILDKRRAILRDRHGRAVSAIPQRRVRQRFQSSARAWVGAKVDPELPGRHGRRGLSDANCRKRDGRCQKQFFDSHPIPLHGASVSDARP